MYNKKISKIVLVSENCDYIELMPDDFLQLNIYGIDETIGVNNYQFKNGEFEREYHCKEFSILVLDKVKNKRSYIQEMCKEDKGNAYDLMKSYSFTMIEIYYGKKKIQIGLPWAGDSDYNNEAQFYCEYEKDDDCSDYEAIKVFIVDNEIVRNKIKKEISEMLSANKQHS